jgi:hypothetical protein
MKTTFDFLELVKVILRMPLFFLGLFLYCIMVTAFQACHKILCGEFLTEDEIN